MNGRLPQTRGCYFSGEELNGASEPIPARRELRAGEAAEPAFFALVLAILEQDKVWHDNRHPPAGFQRADALPDKRATGRS